jgi:hypothetical protein
MATNPTSPRPVNEHVHRRSEIIDLYEGVEVVHSFVEENGQVFDCIPVEHQPSPKGTSTGPADAPDAPDSPAAVGGISQGLQVQAQLGKYLVAALLGV